MSDEQEKTQGELFPGGGGGGLQDASIGGSWFGPISHDAVFVHTDGVATVTTTNTTPNSVAHQQWGKVWANAQDWDRVRAPTLAEQVAEIKRQRDRIAEHERITIPARRSGKTAATQAMIEERMRNAAKELCAAQPLRAGLLGSLARPGDPPLGDIRWLIERPVTIHRDGHKIEAPLIALKFLTREEYEDMPSAYERQMIRTVLQPECGVTFLSKGDIWVFAEEF